MRVRNVCTAPIMHMYRFVLVPPLLLLQLEWQLFPLKGCRYSEERVVAFVTRQHVQLSKHKSITNTSRAALDDV